MPIKKAAPQSGFCPFGMDEPAKALFFAFTRRFHQFFLFFFG